MATSSANTASVLTANRLQDGVVVFLNPDLSWSESFNNARLIDSAEPCDELIEAASRVNPPEHVVDPYAIDVEVGADQKPARAVRLRERIRANGPTV